MAAGKTPQRLAPQWVENSGSPAVDGERRRKKNLGEGGSPVQIRTRAGRRSWPERLMMRVLADCRSAVRCGSVPGPGCFSAAPSCRPRLPRFPRERRPTRTQRLFPSQARSGCCLRRQLGSRPYMLLAEAKGMPLACPVEPHARRYLRCGSSHPFARRSPATATPSLGSGGRKREGRPQ